MPKDRPLTAKQKRFVEEYLVDLNGAQAAIRAGYAPQNAKVTAAKLLKKPAVAAQIEKHRAVVAKRAEVSTDRVLKELMRIGFSDLRNVFTAGGHLIDPQDWDDDTAAAIQSVKVVTRPRGGTDEDGNKEVEHVHEIKLWSKDSALERLGKHLGMFVEKRELTGKNGGPIETAGIVTDDPAAVTELRNLLIREAAGEETGV